ncbi:MAG: DUF1150 family protein [Rhodospirillales bacterium]|nr:DUF1150 family protein [Rhodospirillales bacterium]
MRAGLSPMSPEAFADFALTEIAYVKPLASGRATRYAIHAADGTRLGIADDRATAFAAVRQQDLEPVSVQ